jgi:hypothetical protein
MQFSLPLLFIGFLTGLLIVSVFEPVRTKMKVLPDVRNPDMVMKQEQVDNGCYRMHPLEVPCPSEFDSMNLLSLQHK